MQWRKKIREGEATKLKGYKIFMAVVQYVVMERFELEEDVRLSGELDSCLEGMSIFNGNRSLFELFLYSDENESYFYDEKKKKCSILH